MIGNKLEPFKFWCQKVLPNVYDDSLSYYEYLCKLNEYLNEVIGQINTLTDNMEDYESDLSAQWLDYKTDLTNQWTETKNYIDNYFNNLNVQTEINNKLDQMASDGTLDTLLLPYFNAYKTDINAIVGTQNERLTTLENRMNTYERLPEGSTTGDAELIGIRTPQSGFNCNQNYSTAGDSVRGQVAQLNVQDKVISYVPDFVEELLYNIGNYSISTSTGEFIFENTPTRLSTVNIYKVTKDTILVNNSPTTKIFRVFYYDDNGDFVNYIQSNATEYWRQLKTGDNIRLQIYNNDNSSITVEAIKQFSFKEIEPLYTDRIFRPYTINSSGEMVSSSYSISPTFSSKINSGSGIIATGIDYSKYFITITYSDEFDRLIRLDRRYDDDKIIPLSKSFNMCIGRYDLQALTINDVIEIINTFKFKEAETTYEKIMCSLINKAIDSSTGDITAETYNYRLSTNNIITIEEDCAFISKNVAHSYRIYHYNANNEYVGMIETANNALIKGEKIRLCFVRQSNSEINYESVLVNYYQGMTKPLKNPSEIFNNLMTSTNKNVKIVGDSIAQGVGGTGFAQDGEHIISQWYRNPNGYCWANLFSSLCSYLYNITVVNNACRGTNSGFVVTNWNTLISETDNVIICCYGTNDRGQIADSEESLNNFRKIKCMASIQGKDVIFFSPIPAGLNNELNNTHNYDQIYYHMEVIDKNINIASDNEYVSLFDICSEWVNNNDITLTDYLDGSELHPNDDLYYKMFVWICKSLHLAPKIKDATW